MKTAAIIVAILAVALLAFGGWGRFTEKGRTQFDEMAGMVPLFAWWLGWIMAAVAMILLAMLALKK